MYLNYQSQDTDVKTTPGQEITSNPKPNRLLLSPLHVD